MRTLRKKDVWVKQQQQQLIICILSNFILEVKGDIFVENERIAAEAVVDFYFFWRDKEAGNWTTTS